MKKLQLLALAILFAITGSNMIEGKCDAGQVKDSQGKCITKKRAADDKKKAGDEAKKTLKTTGYQIHNISINAINAYNKQVAIMASASSTATTNAALTATTNAAQNALNNEINTLQSWLQLVQNNQAVTFATAAATSSAGGVTGEMNSAALVPGGMSSSAVIGGGMSSTAQSSFQCGNTPSMCDDNSTASCADGTPLSGLPCANIDGSTDGSVTDANGVCPDYGMQMMCNDGINYPLCSDQTPPC